MWYGMVQRRFIEDLDRFRQGSDRVEIRIR